MHLHILIPTILASFALAAPQPFHQPTNRQSVAYVEPIIYHPHPSPQPFHDKGHSTPLVKRTETPIVMKRDMSGGIKRKNAGPANWKSVGLPLSGAGKLKKRDLVGQQPRFPIGLPEGGMREERVNERGGWGGWFGKKIGGDSEGGEMEFGLGNGY
ncbi:hypothetical protein BJ508DRAFT_342660 [Ascobolus immersus RN42]|uniref:Uncharacterized protein n=1 Tax=Ascobolus immersus RN42 TaxID=1160509 RepID=A0A3N4IBP2_ASCIM|nr:hypothetical protein BJ508DRAFT_342660 [Ascobolus immersus RN42]